MPKREGNAAINRAVKSARRTLLQELIEESGDLDVVTFDGKVLKLSTWLNLKLEREQ